MVTPTPRPALIVGKAFAAGIRALTQVVVVLVVSALLGVDLTDNPLKILGAALIVVLGAGFFATLSMTIAGVALSRDRLMGIGQAITMPLFFASNALYPTKIMPGWVQVITKVNPLSYQVNALRGLLIGTSAPSPRTSGWSSPSASGCRGLGAARPAGPGANCQSPGLSCGPATPSRPCRWSR